MEGFDHFVGTKEVSEKHLFDVAALSQYLDKYLVGFNAFKDHLSLFPTARPLEIHKDKLQGYKLSKGTIQFTETTNIPESIIKDLLLVRMSDISK